MCCILKVLTTDPYFYLRDPAIVLHIPSAEGETYEINKLSIEIKFRYRRRVHETSNYKGYDSFENYIGGDGW